MPLFGKSISLAVLLAIAPSSFAEIFKCIDKTTGKMAFTDQACPDDTSGAYQAVGSTNMDSGFDEADAARRQNARKKEADEFRRGWTSHNKEVAAEAKREIRQRARDQEERTDESERGIIDLEHNAAKRQKDRRDRKLEEENY